jgi:2'-5' RNA ligase
MMRLIQVMATTSSTHLTGFNSIVEGDGGDRGCLMVFLTTAEAMPIREWATEHISADNLAKDGYEAAPHVTVLYGFSPDVTVDAVADACHAMADRVDMTMGKVSRFEGDDQKWWGSSDVIKIDVISDDLTRLNAHLRKTFKKDVEITYPGYRPHVTLAYVKHGACKELDGHAKFEGNVYRITSLVYSGPGSKEKTVIGLGTAKETMESSRFQLMNRLLFS